MNCPTCGTSDFFVNFLGPDCLNLKCKHFKNGSKNGMSIVELAAQKAKKYEGRSFQFGDTVMADVGGIVHMKANGILVPVVLTIYHPEGIPQAFWNAMNPDKIQINATDYIPSGETLSICIDFLSWPD